MNVSRLGGWLLPAAMSLTACASTQQPATEPAPIHKAAEAPTLPSTDQLAALTRPAGGVAGVAMVHIESGAHTSLRGNERFPMASVFKLPLAIAVMARAERGELDLASKITLRARDLAPGHSPLAARLVDGELTLRIDELVAAILIESDNTAADALLRVMGGGAAVTAALLQKDLPGIDVSRSERQLALDFYGLNEWTESDAAPNDMLNALLKGVSRDALAASGRRFVDDARDSARPEAIAALLVRLQKGELLGREMTERLLGWMRKTPTGPGRLRGMLPEGTKVAHKTGTGGSYDGLVSAINDVGIISLPDGTHLAIAVFLKATPGEMPQREQVIAELAKAAYETALARLARPSVRSLAVRPGGIPRLIGRLLPSLVKLRFEKQGLRIGS